MSRGRAQGAGDHQHSTWIGLSAYRIFYLSLKKIEILKAEIVKINLDRAQRLQDNLTLNQMVVTSAEEIETLRAEREIRLRDIETLKAEIVTLNLDRAERLRDISNSQSNGRHVR